MLLGVRVSNNLTDEIDSRCFQESNGKSDRTDGKSTARLVSHQKIHLNRTAGSEDISLPSWSIPGRRSDGLIFFNTVTDR